MEEALKKIQDTLDREELLLCLHTITSIFAFNSGYHVLGWLFAFGSFSCLTAIVWYGIKMVKLMNSGDN